MYEELLPHWKHLCRRISTGEISVFNIPRSDPWVQEVFVKRGLVWQFTGPAGCRDVMVQRVMLFTWEQGIAE